MSALFWSVASQLDRGALLDKGVGVDRDEQVRLHLSRLFDAGAERDEIVAVAGEHDAGIRQRFQARLEFLGHGQHDVLLARAGGADRAGVLAAVAGVEGDRHHAHHVVRRLGWLAWLGGRLARCRRNDRLGGARRRIPAHRRDFRFQARHRIGRHRLRGRHRHRRHGGRGAVAGRPLALFDQGGDRVGFLDRIQVENQAVFIFRHRRQREHLRFHGFLQVEYQAHHVRAVLADAHLLDVRVVRLDFRHQAFQGVVQGQAVDVDHQPRRIRHQEVLGL
jgi:hypothetical protein